MRATLSRTTRLIGHAAGSLRRMLRTNWRNSSGRIALLSGPVRTATALPPSRTGNTAGPAARLQPLPLAQVRSWPVDVTEAIIRQPPFSILVRRMEADLLVQPYQNTLRDSAALQEKLLESGSCRCCVRPQSQARCCAQRGVQHVRRPSMPKSNASALPPARVPRCSVAATTV